jgi:hypothetical protein
LTLCFPFDSEFLVRKEKVKIIIFSWHRPFSLSLLVSALFVSVHWYLSAALAPEEIFDDEAPDKIQDPSAF